MNFSNLLLLLLVPGALTLVAASIAALKNPTLDAAAADGEDRGDLLIPALSSRTALAVAPDSEPCLG